jgi:hypothetical protein
MRELSSSIADSVRNRNLLTESIAGKELPMKYDILNGKPIRDWDVPTRFYNMFSPIQINFDEGVGRQLLFNSNFDMAQSFKSLDGISLREHPQIRSEWQRLVGEQNLEQKLNKLAMRKDVKASVAKMQADLASTVDRDLDPMKDYVHNRLIANMFETAKNKAKAKLMQMPEVKQLFEERSNLKAKGKRSLAETQAVQGIVELNPK